MKKSNILIFICLFFVAVIVLFILLFIKNVLSKMEYNYSEIGIKSSFNCNANDIFSKFEVRKDENIPYLYFESNGSNTKYKLQYNILSNKFLKDIDKVYKSDRFKKIKFDKYEGYIYCNEKNHVEVILKVKDYDDFTYVINLYIETLKDNEKDFLYDSILKDNNDISNFLSSIDIDTDIEIFYEYLNANVNKGSSKTENKE